MTREVWLILGIASLVLAFGLLFAITVKVPDPIPPPTPEPIVISTPANNNTETTPPTVTTSEPTSEPTPEPTPSSVKQIGDNLYRVRLVSKDWYDSGIPVIANQYFYFTFSQKGFLLKVADKTLFNPDGLGVNERGQGWGKPMVVDNDFHSTLKFKLDDEVPVKEILITVKFVKDHQCPHEDNSGHMATHAKYEKWRDSMLAKIARQ